LSLSLRRCDNATVVVQCPSCQTRFRVADDKVGDRGVRVRCSSCKDVFSVKKSGAAESASSATAGNTIDLSSLDPPIPKPKTGPVAGGSPSRSASSADKLARPAPAAARSAQPSSAAKGGSRLDVDDLFGMAELTGDAAKKPAAAKGKDKSDIDFDSLDLGLDDEPLAPPKPKTGPLAPAKPKTGPIPPKPSTGPIAPKPKTGPIAPKPKTGPLAPKPKTGPVRETADGSSGLELDESAFDKKRAGDLALSDDPFEGVRGRAGRPDSKPIDKPRTDKNATSDRQRSDRVTKSGKQYKSIFQKPPEPPPSARRELVSSALTGLVGAALAVIVVLVAAVSDEGSAGWLGFTARSDVVATRVVSGLYDTASGKPVFFVRGRVENRGRKPHGPVRVVAELLAAGESEGKAEAIAGAEPNPEEVYALRNSADADKLQRALLAVDAERRLRPGASLPFFAVIADPPADLQRHRLHLRLEPIDAWAPHRTAAASK
jgi:predicted Zn finger-like uncharacterized protein